MYKVGDKVKAKGMGSTHTIEEVQDHHTGKRYHLSGLSFWYYPGEIEPCDFKDIFNSLEVNDD